MAFEVNNLVTPYLSVCYIIAHFDGGVTAQGSGVIISGDDVLTASHVVYDSKLHSWATEIEIIPGYDGQTGGSVEAPLGVFAGYHAAFFTNFDPDGDHALVSGDGVSSTLSGSELDVAVIHTSAGNGVQPAFQNPFYLGTNFTSGSLRITGYPASAAGNPLEQAVNMTKNGVDNSFFSPVGLGPGSSGGPVWDFVNGLPTVFGVVSTTSSMASIQAHLNWIQSYARTDNLFNIGTAADDIYRPYVPEFSVGKPNGFKTGYTLFPAGVEGVTNLWGNFDGGTGIDTVALPWHSVTSKFNNTALFLPVPAGSDGTVMSNWMVTATKDAQGKIHGWFQIGSSGISLENVERVAFSDVIYDLTKLAIGGSFGVGPLQSSTPATGLEGSGPNPVQLSIASIAGEQTDDFMVGGDTIDQMTGFDGNDWMLGGKDNDTLSGGNGDDTLEGQRGADTISGDAGDDNIRGGAGADTMDGGDGFDTLSYAGSRFGVKIDLRSGVAALANARGDSFVNFEDLEGSKGDDSLTGDDGINFIFGAEGDDTIRGAGGADTLDGGGGADTLTYTKSATGIAVDLATGSGTAGDAEGDFVSHFENVQGTSFSDNITGNESGNILDGSSGDDTLSAGEGDDWLIGGKGADSLDGGSGFDTFVLTARASSRDTIITFSAADDTLEIAAVDFGGGLLAGSSLLASQFVINATGKAGDADDRFILNLATGELVYDSNGDAQGGARIVATFTAGIPTLTEADFVIL